MRSVCGLLPLLAASVLSVGAVRGQSVTRWEVSWTDDSYRYVDGQRVPTGRQTFVLSVAKTVGDSVVATLPTANPAITDTLVGVMSGTAIALRSRPRAAMARRDENSEVSSPTVTVELRLAIRENEAAGTLTRTISGMPGVTFPKMETAVAAKRLP